MQGTIKTFVPNRGFGFIRPDGGARDIFFHQSNSVIPREEIAIGLRVEFRVIGDFRRPGHDQATDVTVQNGVSDEEF